MKRTGLLIGAGIALLAFSGRAFARSLQNLQLSLGNFRLTFQGFTPVLLFRINVYNPDIVAVNIRSVMGNVVYKNQVVSNFNTANTFNITVPPKKEVAIESRATLGLGAIVSAILQKQPGAAVVVRGSLFTGGAVEIPFNRTWNAATGAVS